MKLKRSKRRQKPDCCNGECGAYSMKFIGNCSVDFLPRHFGCFKYKSIEKKINEDIPAKRIYLRDISTDMLKLELIKRDLSCIGKFYDKKGIIPDGKITRYRG